MILCVWQSTSTVYFDLDWGRLDDDGDGGIGYSDDTLETSDESLTPEQSDQGHEFESGYETLLRSADG